MTFALKDRESGQTKFEATRNDLVFGANAQLRSIADAYAGSDGHRRFVADFVRVWDKVMMLDRFDGRVTSATRPWRPDRRARALQDLAP
jgi:catalase-peroxidase